MRDESCRIAKATSDTCLLIQTFLTANLFMNALSTPSPTLALASPSRVKSVLTKPHIRVPLLRVRWKGGREGGGRNGNSHQVRQTDRQTHVRDDT